MKRKKMQETAEEYIFPALVLPFGGHLPGDKDCHGQRFTAQTDFKTELLPLPPVIYAHGYPLDADGVADRTVVGRTINRWYDEQGGWALIGITKGTALTAEVMSSYRNQTLKFSSSALLAALNKVDGESYDVWLAGEFSVVTDKTPVRACNLLTRAETYGKMAIDNILNDLPDDQRVTLEKLIEEAGVANDNQPAGGEGDGEDLEEFADGAEDDDMKPEEVTAAVMAALQPLTDRVAALEKPAPVVAEKPVVDDKQKTDAGDVDPGLTALIESKATRSKTDAGVMTLAVKLIDGYIAAAQVAPAEREAMVGLAVAAINGDDRKKSDNGAVAALMTMIESRGKAAIDPKSRLAGFGGSQGSDATAEDVTSMAKAAMTD